MSSPGATPATVPAPPLPPRGAVRQKSRAVVEYHHDPERPGKPVWLLVLSGIIAFAALAAMVFLAYLVWFRQSVSTSTAVWGYVALGLVYLGAVFAFSYGWELYDTRRALKKTVLFAILGLLVVVLAAILFAVLKEDADFIGGGGSKGSDAVATAAPAATQVAGRGAGYGNDLGWMGGSSSDPGESGPASPAVPTTLTCPSCALVFPDEGNLKCPRCRADLFGPNAGGGTIPTTV